MITGMYVYMYDLHLLHEESVFDCIFAQAFGFFAHVNIYINDATLLSWLFLINGDR